MPLKRTTGNRYVRTPLAERFWPKVERRGPSDCWEWLASRNAHGYGRISTSRGKSPLGAHRVAWELARGPIPEGLDVLHRCDNPPCCNPSHLFIGTARDNARDMLSKRRDSRGDGHGLLVPHGETHHSAKLAEADVRAIRAAHAMGEGASSIARRYAVWPSTISAIALRRIWKSITP